MGRSSVVSDAPEASNSNEINEDGNSSDHDHEEQVVPPPSHHHKVSVPAKQRLCTEFGATMKETFFADDPLRHFKDQSIRRKIVLCIQTLFPILDWGRHYDLSKLKGDLIAGLTIASLAIPQDIGYAKLANLDPKFGLYSSFVPPLIYACMGSSRDIAIGPVAVVSLLLGSMLRAQVDPITNPVEYTRLALTATFFAGITQVTLGFFRLGFLIDFLSHAAIVGFTAGAAVTIALQQLKGMLGIKNFTRKTDIVSVIECLVGSARHGWNWQTIAIGVSFLVFLLAAKQIGKRIKNLFWVSAIAPLLSVVLATLFVYITRADKDGVKIVHHIEKGINPASIHQLRLSGKYGVKGFKIGAIAGMVALTEATAIGRTFATLKDYQIDGNKEMVALGAMNVIGSMTSCYVSTGSFSRSAVNYMAGSNTMVSNIVMSIVVLVTLLFLTPLFKFTPNAILAAIIINAVVGLVDYKAVVLIWKIDKFDFIACIGAFFGVVFISVEIGLLIAVAISFAKILVQVTRPRTAILGNIPGTKIYRNVQQYPEAEGVPGILIVRVDSAIYFSNSNYVKERIVRWLVDEGEKMQKQGYPGIHCLIVEMSPVTDVDTSGIHALEELYKCLKKREVQLVLANPGPVVMEKLHASLLTNLIGEDNIFLTVAQAVHDCQAKLMAMKA